LGKAAREREKLPFRASEDLTVREMCDRELHRAILLFAAWNSSARLCG